LRGKKGAPQEQEERVEEKEEKVGPEPLPPPAPVAPVVAQVSHEEAGVEAAACVSEQRLHAAAASALKHTKPP
jgi:hypothetical protein